MPFAGDDVVLFLHASPIDKGRYEPQVWTGVYHVDDPGMVEALDTNPFAAWKC